MFILLSNTISSITWLCFNCIWWLLMPWTVRDHMLIIPSTDNRGCVSYCGASSHWCSDWRDWSLSLFLQMIMTTVVCFSHGISHRAENLESDEKVLNKPVSRVQVQTWGALSWDSSKDCDLIHAADALLLADHKVEWLTAFDGPLSRNLAIKGRGEDGFAYWYPSDSVWCLQNSLLRPWCVTVNMLSKLLLPLLFILHLNQFKKHHDAYWWCILWCAKSRSYFQFFFLLHAAFTHTSYWFCLLKTYWTSSQTLRSTCDPFVLTVTSDSNKATDLKRWQKKQRQVNSNN